MSDSIELPQEPEVAVLVDEEGNEYQFHWEMSIEFENGTYAVLHPAEEMEGFEPDEVMVFRLSDDDKNPVLEPVEDEDLAERVYQEYLAILDEQDTEEP